MEKIRSYSRRAFLKFVFVIVSLLLYSKALFAFLAQSNESKKLDTPKQKKGIDQNQIKIERNKGIDNDGISRVFYSSGYSPESNIKNAIHMKGGIQTIVNKDDVVVLKPNAQWWNHGTTNTDNMKGFIELVLSIPEFKGEIIIAENHHYKKPASRGWTTEHRNGEYNLYELVDYFNRAGYSNVSKYHWIDGGPNPTPQEGDGGFGEVVNPGEKKDGYVWLKDVIYESPENRRCIMTYPVFSSSYSGTRIDLKNGSHYNGGYKNNVKLINFSCLNHHSSAFGATASIKNLMGIVDMTCGYQGSLPEGFYNSHFIGKMSKMFKIGIDLIYYGKRFGFGPALGIKIMKAGYWNSQYTGGALGYWMDKVKMPDLNILAAEYTGWGGRGVKGTDKRAHTNCVAVSTDPVALDYIGVKTILNPCTPKGQKKYSIENSVNYEPFYNFLVECNKQGIGNLDPGKIEVIAY